VNVCRLGLSTQQYKKCNISDNIRLLRAAMYGCLGFHF